MSVIADVASEVLDFPNIKRRSVAARNYRCKINTVTPGTVTGSKSATLEFVLPSNLAGSYMDFSQLYLKFGMTPGGASNNLDKCGAYGIISRLEVFSNSAQIMTLNNYNVLVSTLVDTDATIGYKGGVGKVLAGLQGSGSLGEYMVSGTTRTFCLPLILTPFAMQKKLVPLFSLDSIRIRITLEDFTNVFVGSGATTGYTIADAQLCGYVCELSGSAQQMVDNMTQGVYQLLCPCYQNIQTTMATQTTGVAASLGISVSSLERILIVHRIATSALANQTLGARITNGLSNFQVNIDSQLYPQNPIYVGDAGAEALAEYLISSHAISDFQNDAHIASQLYGYSGTIANSSLPINAYEAAYSYLNIPATSNVSNAWFNALGAGTVLTNASATTGAVSTAGSFVAALELENSTSAARSDRLFSGVSTLGSVVQYLGNYAGGANTVAATIDFFCHYTIMCTLNMRTIGVWQVQV